MKIKNINFVIFINFYYILPELESNSKKSVQFAEEVEVKTVKREPEVVEVEIDENKMDRLLHILLEADPQSGATDTQEMIDLEGNYLLIVV